MKICNFKKGDLNKGFTLIELLVAISIIAVLTAILLPNFIGTRERAADTKKIQDAVAIKNALRLYYNDNQSYPVGAGVACSSLTITDYLPGIVNIGCTYYQENNGDGFRLCIPLNADNAGEGAKSQQRCGIDVLHCGTLAVGETLAKIYEVCAN